MYLPEKIHDKASRQWFSINFLLISLVLLFCSKFSLSQPSNENYPVQFNQFMFCYPLVNPSAIGINNNREIITGYQRPVTGFTGLATYYFNISFPPYRIRDGNNNKSIVGARFYNENEGAYINRMRFYVIYSFHTRISNNLNFSGGLDLGAMNFSVKATPTTEGASVLKPDADAGIWLYNDRFHAGISVNQIFNSVFRPLDETTVLPVHVNLTASYEILANEYMEIRPHLLFTYPYYSDKSISIALSGLFFQKIISAVNWKQNVSISAMLGVSDMSISKSDLDIILSYSFSVRRAALAINILEISALLSL